MFRFNRIVSMSAVAGLTTLRSLDDAFYEKLTARTTYLVEGLEALAAEHRRSITVNHVCGMFSVFFDAPGAVTQFDHVANANIDIFNQFFHAMLDQGVYLAPSAFEAGFLGAQHTTEVLDATLSAVDRVFSKL